MSEFSVFWDWDGTLFDSLGVFLRIYNSFTYNNLSAEEFRKKLNSGWMDDILQELEKKKALSNIIVETLKVMMKDTRLFKGVAEIARACSRNYIVSSSLRPIVVEKLAENKVVELFSDVITADIVDSPFKKDIVKYAMEKTGADPGRTAYVGDMVEDVLAAKEAGIKSIAVTWGFNERDELEAAKPDFIVDSPAELLDVIRGLGSG